MAVECSVEEIGGWSCDLAYSAAQALRCLEAAAYEVVIVDYMLHDGSCAALALALRQRGIPFLIYSDYRRPKEPPPVLRDAPWIEKIADHSRVLRALRELTARRVLPLAAAV
jgi:CheY-like chemotaxis protein